MLITQIEDDQEEEENRNTKKKMMIGNGETTIDMSLIPREIWRTVASQLDPPTLVCFRQTCSSWRRAAAYVTKEQNLFPRTHLFTLSDDPTRDIRLLLAPAINPGTSPDVRCCGSYNNWLVLVTPSRRLVALSQFPTQTVVELPHQTTLPHLPHTGEELYRGRRYVVKIALSAEPTSAVCTAVALYGQWRQVAVCKPGDRAWTPVVGPETLFFADGAFAGGVFYLSAECAGNQKTHVLTRGGDGAWELRRLEVFDEFSRSSKVRYLMEFEGRLMAALRIKGGDRRTAGFRVFQREEGTGGQMEEVGEIGERAVVVSRASSVCVSTRDFPYLRRNCVYFMETSELEGGIYCMRNRSVQWLVEGDENTPLFLHLFKLLGWNF